MKEVRIYTDGGSRPIKNERHAGWGAWLDFGDKEINYGIYGPSGLGQSNNVGELMGYIGALEECLLKGYNVTEFLLDSTYVLDSSQKRLKRWVKEGFDNGAGGERPNRAYWEKIDVLQQKLTEVYAEHKIKKPKYTHVAAHSSIVGNEHADVLATKGVYASANGIEMGTVLRYVPEMEIETPETVTPEVKVKPKKVKVTPPNAFFCLTQILDISHRDYLSMPSGDTIYLLETFNTKTKGADDEVDKVSTKRKKQEAKTRNLGIIDPDMIEGVVFAKERCPIYDKIKNWQNEISPANPNYPYLVHWAKVTTAATWKEINTTESLPFVQVQANIFLDDEATNITYFLDVPRRATAAMDSCMVKVSLLERYQLGELKDVQDITDLFIDTSDKGKKTFKKTNEFDRMVPVKTTYKGKSLTIRLTQKIDMPEVNALKRMFAQENITVKLIKYLETPVSFRHAIIVEGENNIGFYNSPCSSIRMVP